MIDADVDLVIRQRSARVVLTSPSVMCLARENSVVFSAALVVSASVRLTPLRIAPFCACPLKLVFGVDFMRAVR